MGVADLAAATTVTLPADVFCGRISRAYDRNVPRRQTADVVDLVEQHQGQDLAHAGNRTQPIEGSASSTLTVRSRYSSTSPMSRPGVEQMEIELDVMRTLASVKRSAI